MKNKVGLCFFAGYLILALTACGENAVGRKTSKTFAVTGGAVSAVDFSYYGCMRACNSIGILSPYVIIDGETGYETTEEGEKIIEEISRYVNQISEDENVAYLCDMGGAAFSIPEGWNYRVKKYRKEKKEFSISFWKGEDDKKALVLKCTEFFGVCGTGLEEEKIKLNGMKAVKGIYDGKTYGFDYIKFSGDFENYVILADSTDEEWWKENETQVNEILDHFILQPKEYVTA